MSGQPWPEVLRLTVKCQWFICFLLVPIRFSFYDGRQLHPPSPPLNFLVQGACTTSEDTDLGAWNPEARGPALESWSESPSLTAMRGGFAILRLQTPGFALEGFDHPFLHWTATCMPHVLTLNSGATPNTCDCLLVMHTHCMWWIIQLFSANLCVLWKVQFAPKPVVRVSQHVFGLELYFGI